MNIPVRRDDEEVQELRRRLEEAEETLRAIQCGEVDGLVLQGPEGERVYTLQGADHSYRTLIEAMQQGAASLSGDGTILYCNRCFASMVKTPHEKVLGAAVSSFLPPAQQASFEAVLRQGRVSGCQKEFEFQSADRTLLPVYLSISPMPLTESVTLCMVVTDLTEQKKHQHLLEANRMKDDFLAMLSHELRTPLNAIVGWSQILRSGKVDDEDLAEGLEAIHRNANVQTQLVEDLLDVSRIISGKLRLDVQRTELVGVIEAAIAAVAPAAELKGLRIERVLDPLAGPVSGDPARLQQVVWNLLSNAIKFTPRGGKVQVLLERVNSHVEVSVIDTGLGISPNFLPYVFDRFRQADSTTTRRYGGLGLGLAIVKHLVEMHGGGVRAKSPGDGQGSTFVVTLPIAVIHGLPEKARPREADASKSSFPDRVLGGLRVLVVDDEPDARSLIHRVLSMCGAEVALAASTKEAMEHLDVFRPDILVSDIGMPGEDGYDLLRQVRARHPASVLPAAALTAFARPGDRKRALLAGFQTHVVKPVDASELVAVVASLASRTGGSQHAEDHHESAGEGR